MAIFGTPRTFPESVGLVCRGPVEEMGVNTKPRGAMQPQIGPLRQVDSPSKAVYCLIFTIVGKK